MSNGAAPAFSISFTYTDAILSDFEAFYTHKSTTSLSTRVICGIIGVVGAIYFGLQLYHEGLAIARVGYLVICSLMLLVAFSGNRRNGSDGTLQKYRKYYQGRRVDFRIDEDGVYMQLEKQKNAAKSKFREIYGLSETEKCFYLVIKGKAYYILSKAALEEEQCKSLRKYLEKHCKKKFQLYQLESSEK